MSAHDPVPGAGGFDLSPRYGARLLVTLCLLIFTVLVPMLETNATHLLNPAWPAHARLHEGWQLLTNAAIGLLALVRTWTPGRLGSACLLGTLVSGGFVLAWLARDVYGGSMQGTSTAAATWLGVDAAVLVMAAALGVFLVTGLRVWLAARNGPGI